MRTQHADRVPATGGVSAPTDPSWAGVTGWGGLFLFVAGGVVIAFVIAVVASQQTLPPPAADMLADPLFPTALFIVAAVGELLLFPAGVGLYLALRDVARTGATVGAALWLLAVPLFLASRALIISVSQLSDAYTGAANEAARSAYLASANLAIEAQDIFATMALISLGVASILMGWAMLRSPFGGRLGYLVIVASLLAMSAPFSVNAGVPIIAFIGLVLTGIWQMAVGARLYAWSSTLQKTQGETAGPLRHQAAGHGAGAR